jgi:short-subunit dehydrogenase
MSINLTNKVVLITGASSGFGEDAARLFAAEGCKVVLTARRLDRLQQLADEIQNAGGEALAIPVDVNDLNEIKVMVESAIDIYGQIDILFNNAGFGQVDWFENLDPQRNIETIIRVNLIGTMLVTHAVLPHMLKRRSGHIINMSSVSGMVAAPLITTYGASKHGVRAFTDSLRRELAPLGIKVSGIYPGPAHTEFGKKLDNTRSRQAAKRLGYSHLSSEYVARRVVGVAKRPVRSLVIPWWYRIVTSADAIFPSLMDGVAYLFTKYNHRLD